jgi:hypothetical protein
MEVLNGLPELWSQELALAVPALLLELQLDLVEQHTVLFRGTERSPAEMLLVFILLVQPRVRVQVLCLPLTHLQVPIVDY